MSHAADRPVISAVLVCWDLWNYTSLAIESFLRSVTVPFELIIVDNGSSDETTTRLPELATNHKQIRLFRNEANRGGSYAWNQGLSAARGEYVLLLSNDVILPPNWQEPMLAAIRKPGVGMVGPVTNRISGPQQLPSVPYNTFDEMAVFAEKLTRDNAGQGFLTHRLVTFCALFRREVLDRIGGFELLLGVNGIGFEDDDLSLRIILAGYRLWVAKDVFAHHFGSLTISAKTDYSADMQRNIEVFKAKWRVAPGTTEVPLQSLLRDGFLPEWHYSPFTERETAEWPVAPLALQESQPLNFLLCPRWGDPQDGWLDALEAFLTAFDPHAPVGLLIRADPLLVPSLEAQITQMVECAASRNLDLEQGHTILVINDLIPPRCRRALYQAAHAVIDTQPIGKFYIMREEAKACGLAVLQPDPASLRGFAAQHGRSAK